MNSSTDQKPTTKDCDYNQFLDIVRGLPLLAGAPLEVCKVLAYLSVGEAYKTGDMVVQQGEHADAFRYVTCGRLRAFRRTEDREVDVRTLGVGDSLGGLALIVGGKSLFCIQAVEESMVMALSREKFLKAAQRFPQLYPSILEALAGHVLTWEERFVVNHPQEFAALGGEFGVSLF